MILKPYEVRAYIKGMTDLGSMMPFLRCSEVWKRGRNPFKTRLKGGKVKK